MEQDALALLREFDWPHNYSQLDRVITELSATAATQVVTAGDVRRVLSRERNTATLTPKAEDSHAPLDLTRTLDEINREIIQRVLHGQGGNRSATAQSLGISRTSL